jgi:preprotein translocase subunit SecE
MTTRTETQDNALDTAKLVIAVLLLVCAVGGFYYFGDQSLLIRVIGLLVVAGISVAIGLQTERGREINGFFKDAHVEVRKVVWPTYKETYQTTLIVMAMVVVVALFLWFLDWILSSGVKWMMGLGA